MKKIKGIIKKHKKTKILIKNLTQGDIALLSHKNLDEIAAKSLLNSKVLAIINTEKTSTGDYPNKGPMILFNNNIPMYEIPHNFYNIISNNDECEIINNKLFINNTMLCNLKESTYKLDTNKFERTMKNFISNTLEYANNEKDILFNDIKTPILETNFTNKDTLIVSRGPEYRKDLRLLKGYIQDKKPITIGVDGGGDAILELGYIPDIVLGDMDSVSDICLKKSKEIVVHGYVDGKAPGINKIKKLNLGAKVFNFIGTSEDAAIVLSYLNNTLKILLVGSHNNAIDFLEKGRKGMASTFLIRTLLGDNIIDTRGINRIFNK